MPTQAINREYNLKLTLGDVINLIKGFSIEDKLLIEKTIEIETLNYRAKMLSKRVKKNKIKLAEINEEVKAVRRNAK